MGYKYTVVWKVGSTVLDQKGFDYLIPALWSLLMDPNPDNTCWKSLEVR